MNGMNKIREREHDFNSTNKAKQSRKKGKYMDTNNH